MAGMNSFGMTPPTMSFSKTKPVPRSPGLDLHEDVAVLAVTAGLLGVLVLAVRVLRDGLAVRDLGLADVRLDLELAPEAVDDDVEVELAHAADDRLARLLVRVDAEGRVLGRELLERDAELLDVGLGLRLDRRSR